MLCLFFLFDFIYICLLYEWCSQNIYDFLHMYMKNIIIYYYEISMCLLINFNYVSTLKRAHGSVPTSTITIQFYIITCDIHKPKLKDKLKCMFHFNGYLIFSSQSQARLIDFYLKKNHFWYEIFIYIFFLFSNKIYCVVVFFFFIQF